MKKLITVLATAITTVGFAPTAMSAETFPSRPITLVVPWNAGGSVDMTARKLGEALAKQGITVVVENVPGASSTVGLRRVATAAPDGYTLGLATTSLMGAISQKITTALTIDDFTPLVQTTAEQEVLLVPENSPVQTIEDFVDLMKNSSEGVSFGTPGAYTVNHVYAELLAQALDTPLLHVPYSGGSKVLVDLVGEQVDAAVLKPSESKALADSGQIRPIGAFATVRSSVFPDVPTFEEKGIDLFAHGYIPLISYIAGPKDLPEDVQNKLTKAITEAVSDEGYVAFVKEYGMMGEKLQGEALSDVIEEIQNAYDAILPMIAAK